MNYVSIDNSVDWFTTVVVDRYKVPSTKCQVTRIRTVPQHKEDEVV